MRDKERTLGMVDGHWFDESMIDPQAVPCGSGADGPLASVAAIFAGSLLHVAVISLPVLIRDGWQALGHPPAALLVLLTSVWVTAEAWAQCNSPARCIRHSHDRLARGLASLTGVVLLALFWTSLLSAAPLSIVGVGIGAVLMSAGIVLRLAAIARLGRMFRTEVVVPQGQPLVCDGVYGWIRHPSETGLLLAALGACVLLHSVPAWALSMVLLLPLVVLRIELEERWLREAFGDDYFRYARRVRRLVPLVY